MSETVRAESIAREVDHAARQLAQAGRLDLTREFIQHGDVTVYAHVTSVARASLSFAERLGRCWHFGRPRLAAARSLVTRLLSLRLA